MNEKPTPIIEGGRLTAEHIREIEDITKHGYTAEVRRRGQGVIVLEVKKTIKCDTQ